MYKRQFSIVSLQTCRIKGQRILDLVGEMCIRDRDKEDVAKAVTAAAVKEAFRAAHTLKGVCQNLGFTNLYQPCLLYTSRCV